MIRRFPFEVAYLRRTKLSYINLPRLLNDGKRDRSARVPGYVCIQLGEICYLLFMRNGEPFHAVRLRSEGREPVAISEVLRVTAVEIERGENGMIGYYGAPEQQLRAMLAASLALPLGCIGGRADAAALLAAWKADAFDGIIEISEAGRSHYLQCEAGDVTRGFFCEQHVPSPAAEAIGLLVRTAPAATGISRFAPLVGLPAQASPGVLNLYRRIIQLLTQELALRISEPVAANVVRTAQNAISEKHPVVQAFEYGQSGWRVRTLVATPSELCHAAAAWLAQSFGLIAERAGIDPAEVIAKITRDDRFVLEEAGFFPLLPYEVSF
jgi:hypothetical protein